MLPGVVVDAEANRDFKGLWLLVAVDEVVVVVWRGRPTGVTNPVEVPEIARARDWDFDDMGFSAGASFSALPRGTNIPDVGVDAVKYRIPATLPSFFPWNSGCKSIPINDPGFPFTAPTNLLSTLPRITDYLTVPTSPPGARTESPTRIIPGDPSGTVKCSSAVVARDAGLGVIFDPVDSDFRPIAILVLFFDDVDRVGELSADVVPSETRGRDNLLPPPNEGRPRGVGVVEYIMILSRLKLTT